MFKWIDAPERHSLQLKSTKIISILLYLRRKPLLLPTNSCSCNRIDCLLLGAETRQKIEFIEEGRVVNPNKGSD